MGFKGISMELTQEEKQVLTLVGCARVDGIEEWVQKFVDLPKDKIQKHVSKFKQLGLIKKVFMPNEKNLWYFHTTKINPDMLDDDLRFKRDYGSDSKLLDFSDKLKINKNEFEEEISDEELTDWAKRVRKLSDEKIDELWFLCGYIFAEREEKFKAIQQGYISRIRKNLDSAKKVIEMLWDETKTEDVRKNLSAVENS